MSVSRAVIATITVAWLLGIAAMEIGSTMAVPGMTGLVPEAGALVGQGLPAGRSGASAVGVNHC